MWRKPATSELAILPLRNQSLLLRDLVKRRKLASSLCGGPTWAKTDFWLLCLGMPPAPSPSSSEKARPRLR